MPRVTEPAHVTAVRESYDTVAEEYARRVPRPSEIEPVARGMLDAFAEVVRDRWRMSGAGRVSSRRSAAVLARKPAP